jgi:GR25 family glycosyltransferase involved in LPS biosynthesis
MTKDTIDALVYSGFLNAQLEDSVVSGRKFSYGQIACFLSHRKALLSVIEQEEEWAIIFEDDVELVPNFISKLNNVLNTVSQISKFDIIHMYVFDNQRNFFKEYDRPCILETPEGLWGLQMYLVRKESVPSILDKLSYMKAAIDEQITRCELSSFTLVNVQLVKSFHLPSSIESTNVVIGETEDQRDGCTFSDQEQEDKKCSA